MNAITPLEWLGLGMRMASKQARDSMGSDLFSDAIASVITAPPEKQIQLLSTLLSKVGIDYTGNSLNDVTRALQNQCKRNEACRLRNNLLMAARWENLCQLPVDKIRLLESILSEK